MPTTSKNIVKKGQSLLKPEVLNRNNEILKSRHRSCKDKKIVYDASSDEDSNNKKKPIVKTNTKSSVCTSYKKKTQLKKISQIECKTKTNNVCNKASNNHGQSTSGGIKLRIMNQSKVILNINGDEKTEPAKSAVIDDIPKYSVGKVLHDVKPKMAEPPTIVKSECQSDAPLEVTKVKDEVVDVTPAKEFYATLFNNTQDVTLPAVITDTIKSEVKEDVVNAANTLPQTNIETKPLKKKLNLQEYRKRLEGGASNPASRTVSPESIFPDIKINCDKVLVKCEISPTLPSPPLVTEVVEQNQAPKLFDPIKEASRKILLHSQKQKTKRKDYEDIVLSKIPKVNSLDIKPLMTDEEMLKMVTSGSLATSSEQTSAMPPQKKPSNYEEMTLISMGVNTDEKVFDYIKKLRAKDEIKSNETVSHKSGVNFKIKKADNISKHNVFASNKAVKNIKEERFNGENKFDKNRFKDIAATIKSVGNNSDLKMSSNSLFASIQDVVMRKTSNDKVDDRKRESKSPIEKENPTKIKTSIIRQYNPNEECGEDKVIHYLTKDRLKPTMCSVAQQTEITSQLDKPCNITPERKSVNICQKSRPVLNTTKSASNGVTKKVEPHRRSNSRERRDTYRHRSHSRNRPEKRSFSRSRSGSVDRYRSKHTYRRSGSPYRRTKRASSPYSMSRLRSRSRSRSRRRDYSQRHHQTKHARSPPVKKVKISPEYVPKIEKVDIIPVKKVESPSRTPPLRKPTLSESSDSSSR